MNKKFDPRFMQLAIKEARKNILSMDGGPFGACIVKSGKVIAVGRNTVLVSDASCHAEINTIRAASRKLKNFDLSGCVIYSTTEPCPMCFSAIHWARIDAVVYGTTIDDVKKMGFNELRITATQLKKIGKSRVGVYGNFLRDECKLLLGDWADTSYKRLY